MRITELFTFALLQAAAVVSSPVEERGAKVVASKRPHHAVAPYHPGKLVPDSPKRTKTCVVKSNGNGKDDSKNILKSIKDCNNGGHVVFPKDKHFTIGTALDLTFLKHIDLGMSAIQLRYCLTNLLCRHPRNYPIYQRHGLLASQCLQAGLPECHHLLPAWWHRRQCLRWRYS